MSHLARYVPTHYSQVNQYLSGTLYVGSQVVEVTPEYILRGKIPRLCAILAFFADVADNVGRLLALQGEFTMAQAKRRLVEKWGQRPTLERAYRRVIRSMVDWGVLLESDKPGNYIVSRKLYLEPLKLRVWLLDCSLRSLIVEGIPFHQIQTIHILFPFEFEINLPELLASNRFDVERIGLNPELVKVK